MRRTSCLLLAILMIGIHAPAQSPTPEIFPGQHVTSEQIARWLYRGDPRLIAWGAHFAAQQGDPAGISLLPALLDQLAPVPPITDQTDRAAFDRYREAAALLHAIIVTGRTAPAETLSKLAEVFPVAALVLAARLPVPDRTPLLLRWYSVQDQAHGGDLTRTSAMLFAKAPPPGFAADILSATTTSLQIAVVSPGHGTAGFGAGGACSDGGSGLPDTTWPPLFGYHLQASNPDPEAKLLVQAGDLRAFYVSVPFYSGYGHCGDDQPDFHHAVLSEMLAVPEKEMPWQTSSFRNVEWVDSPQFTTAVGKLIAAKRAALDSTATDLARKGLITAAEGDPRPKLVITIEDDREDKSVALPQLRFSDPRTVLVAASSPAK